MTNCTTTLHRILIADGDKNNHSGINKIFSFSNHSIRKETYHSDISESDNPQTCEFELDFTSVGFEIMEKVKLACASRDPYKVVYIDTSHPAVGDYLHFIEEILGYDHDVQILICADRSVILTEIVNNLGVSERLMILKKPYEEVELYQTIVALSCKWDLIQQARTKKEELEDLVSERTSRLAEMNHKLMFTIEKVKRSEQSKDFFLENISKVVRIPLNSIVVNTNLLTKEGLSLQQQKHISTIHQNANELMQVLSNILDMAEIEANNIVPDIQNITLKVFMKELKVFELQAHEKDLDFKIEMEQTLPDKFYSDPDILRQCLVILIENAIRYTVKGHVNIKIILEKEHIRPFLVFYVQDTGPGISIDQQVCMFEPFSPGSSEAGLGLGLAIARKMIHKINGEIKLVNTSESGTTFLLRIPLTEG